MTIIISLRLKKRKNIFDTVISVITGSIAPAIPLLAGAGMGKVLLLILTISGLLSDKKSDISNFEFNF